LGKATFHYLVQGGAKIPFGFTQRGLGGIKRLGVWGIRWRKGLEEIIGGPKPVFLTWVVNGGYWG